MDCSPPGFFVHGLLQAKILEWVAILFSRGSSWLRDRTRSLTLQADSLPSEPPGNHTEKTDKSKTNRRGGLSNRKLFPHSLKAWSPRSRCQQVWFLLKPSSSTSGSSCVSPSVWELSVFPFPPHIKTQAKLDKDSSKQSPFILLLKAISPNTVTFWGTGVSISTHEFYRHTIWSK